MSSSPSIPRKLGDLIFEGKMRQLEKYFITNKSAAGTTTRTNITDLLNNNEQQIFDLIKTCINSERSLLVLNHFLFVDPVNKKDDGHPYPFHKIKSSSSSSSSSAVSLIHCAMLNSFENGVMTKLLLYFIQQHFGMDDAVDFLINSKDEEGKTAMQAASSSILDEKKRLLENDPEGFKKLFPDDNDENTAVLENATDFIQNHVIPWFDSEWKNKILPREQAIYAAEIGDVETLRRLIVDEQLVSANACDVYKYSLLYHAAYGAHLACVDLLIENDADITVRDYRDRTLLMSIIESGPGNLLVAERICDEIRSRPPSDPASSLINAQGNSNDDTALHLAVEADNSEMVRFLLSRGADYRMTPNKQGKTVTDLVAEKIETASEEEKMDRRRFLHDFYDYDPISKTGYMRQPNQVHETFSQWMIDDRPGLIGYQHVFTTSKIFLAARDNINYDKVLLQFCKNCGGDINADATFDKPFRISPTSPNFHPAKMITPFHAACISGHVDLVKRLLFTPASSSSPPPTIGDENDDPTFDFKVDLSILYLNQLPVWELAEHANQSEIVELLLSTPEYKSRIEEAKKKIAERQEAYKQEMKNNNNTDSADLTAKTQDLEEKLKKLEQQARQREEELLLKISSSSSEKAEKAANDEKALQEAKQKYENQQQEFAAEREKQAREAEKQKQEYESNIQTLTDKHKSELLEMEKKLEEQKDEYEERRSQQTQKITMMTDSLNDLTDKLAHAVAENGNLRKELDGLNAKNKSTDDKVNELVAESEKTVASMKKRLDDFEKEGSFYKMMSMALIVGLGLTVAWLIKG